MKTQYLKITVGHILSEEGGLTKEILDKMKDKIYNLSIIFKQTSFNERLLP